MREMLRTEAARQLGGRAGTADGPRRDVHGAGDRPAPHLHAGAGRPHRRLGGTDGDAGAEAGRLVRAASAGPPPASTSGPSCWARPRTATTPGWTACCTARWPIRRPGAPRWPARPGRPRGRPGVIEVVIDVERGLRRRRGRHPDPSLAGPGRPAADLGGRHPGRSGGDRRAGRPRVGGGHPARGVGAARAGGRHAWSRPTTRPRSPRTPSSSRWRRWSTWRPGRTVRSGSGRRPRPRTR